MFGRTVVSSSTRKMAGPEDECMILQNIRTIHSTQHHVPEITQLAQAKKINTSVPYRRARSVN